MLKTLIEKFPQKKNASFDFIGAIISIFSAENFFLNEFTNFHRPSSHLYPGRSSRYKFVKVAKTRSVSSGNVRLDPINASQF